MSFVRLGSVMALVTLLFAGACFAQEPEVPLTWKGAGEANFISSNGEQEIEFDLEFHVDEDGMVTGKTTNDEGSTELEKFYYGNEVDGEYPVMDSRRLIIVLRLKSSDMPLLVIMNGTVLGDKYFYGELRLASPNEDGMEEALDLGDKMATE
ncbi:MAG: hypothetical protein KC931_05760, partial [Candidatus Omnitrophica bacterium]|nr:hypothetical protein [Candidatus Omnitrophota bacterium]